MKTHCLIAALLMTPLFAFADDTETTAVGGAALPAVSPHRPARLSVQLWRASIAALTIANTADVVSSLQVNHRRPDLKETGWLYGGRFGTRGIAIKTGYIGGTVLVQWLLVRKYPRLAKWLAPINVGPSLIAGRAAWHNSQM
jgi:hypothetical protein